MADLALATAELLRAEGPCTRGTCLRGGRRLWGFMKVRYRGLATNASQGLRGFGARQRVKMARMEGFEKCEPANLSSQLAAYGVLSTPNLNFFMPLF